MRGSRSYNYSSKGAPGASSKPTILGESIINKIIVYISLSSRSLWKQRVQHTIIILIVFIVVFFLYKGIGWRV